ncbi:GNAT family N-acetyltransferase [Paenibacillus monticola]|uniref:GNAT family N-acetyltransferase n=1 Tax=Paenibacillus monticola TaxID=2666075 RepID=A0A7X2H1M4_9BACL|nr:GNAT family N-acetyltransferase [Paenibacillus monticola]MRN51890.1 GNAT family N-acetyltransferase [Paenibacillus monticola]
MQNYRIERASMEDMELLIPLFDEYRMFYGQVSDPTGARDFLTERLKLDESVIFMAVVGEGINKRAGGLTQLYPSFSSVTMQRLWILNDLFVSAAQRGFGLGSMLLTSARAFAVSTGTKGLSLTTMTDNMVAQRLYERQGYLKDDEFYTYNLFFK